MKCPNIQIIGVPEEEDKKKGHEKIFEEIIVENLPKMGKEIATQVQENQRVPNRINQGETPQYSIIRVPEKEDKKKGCEKILEEIIAENFPKIGKEIGTQVQETQRVPNRINARRNTPRHILIKLTKIKHKEQILKAAGEKQ